MGLSVYLNLISHGLSIIPNNNLVSNIGVGYDSTHTAAHPFQNSLLEGMTEMVHPEFIIADMEADIHSQTIEYSIEQSYNLQPKKKSLFRFLK